MAKLCTKNWYVMAAVVLIGMFVAADAQAQMWNFAREDMLKYTADNPYERFEDGRPKVPDEILKRAQPLVAEQLLGFQRQYPTQFVSHLKNLNPEIKLVGRAFTMQFMPMRPDIDGVIQKEWREAHDQRLNNQVGLDMLQPGDVLVADAGGNSDWGGIIGDNLAYYIWTTTGTGFVIDGAIRDEHGISEIPMPGYFTQGVPPAIRNVMITGINVPVRIGNTTVMPGDVVIGDREGITFVPPSEIGSIVEQAEITALHDEWTRMMFDTRKFKSSEIYGSPSDPELRQQYQDFLKQRMGEEAYNAYQERQQQRRGNRGGARRGGN